MSLDLSQYHVVGMIAAILEAGDRARDERQVLQPYQYAERAQALLAASIHAIQRQPGLHAMKVPGVTVPKDPTQV
jgi:hypothetical protein